MNIFRKFINQYCHKHAAQYLSVNTKIEQQDDTSKRQELKFWCPSPMAKRRAKQLYIKEPQTIEWIRKIPAGKTLWDIGANVGTFTIFAAHRNVSTIAFEPNAENYILLVRNIELNGLARYASAYAIAPSNNTKQETLYLRLTEPGRSGAAVGAPVDQCENRFDSGREQGVLCVCGDDLVNNMGFAPPDYLKLDVDGHELEILEGMTTAILKSGNLESISVEIESASTAALKIVPLLNEFGYIETAREATSKSKDCSAFNVIFNLEASS